MTNHRAILADSIPAREIPGGSGTRSRSNASPARAPSVIASRSRNGFPKVERAGTRVAIAILMNMHTATMSCSTKWSSQPSRMAGSGQLPYRSSWNSSWVESANAMHKTSRPPRHNDDHEIHGGAPERLPPPSNWVMGHPNPLQTPYSENKWRASEDLPTATSNRS